MKQAKIWVTKPEGATFNLVKSSDATFRWHYHEGYSEIILMCKGTTQAMVGDYQGVIKPGEVYLLGPKLPHVIYSMKHHGTLAKECIFYVLNIAMDFLAETIPELEGLTRMQREFKRGLVFGKDTYSKVILKLHDMHRSNSIRSMVHMLEILEIFREHKGTPIAGASYDYSPGMKDSKRINRICQFLHSNFGSEFRLQQLAEHVHMPTVSLCRLFKRATGKTVMAYVIELRVSKACKLLLETDMTILMVSYSSGFGSLSNFNKMFRRVMKMSPGEYQLRGATSS